MSQEIENQSYPFQIQIEGSYEKHLGGLRGGEHSEWCNEKEYLAALYKLREMAKSCELAEENKTRPLEQSRSMPRLHYYDGGIDTTYIVNITYQAASFGVLSLFLKKAADAIIELIKLRGSRGVTVKAGEYSVEVKGSSDMAEAIKTLQELEAKFPIKSKVTTAEIAKTPQPNNSGSVSPTAPPDDDSRYMPKE